MGLEGTDAIEALRLFVLCHADHEGGNVSAHVSHAVSSAHSDVFYAVVASLCGLAGPLHGLANQQALSWQKNALRQVGHDAQKLRDYAHAQLAAGKKIPGFGHAVLRVTDPRYTLFREWGEQTLHKAESSAKRKAETSVKRNPKQPRREPPSDSPVQAPSRSGSGEEISPEALVRFNHLCADVITEVMKEYPKIQSPYPNVDMGSGTVLTAVGIIEPTIYTVLFGLSRCLGVIASGVWSRMLKLPIERPKSVTLETLNNLVKQAPGNNQ
ncbi:citrate synthase [Gregarina niphandrodes]|uniref:Citrate synthase n=1 Tax=Gregarina niphandrodes TaxID=110365 RepID=A0A023AZ11_GRENI|nr:citrate synthase [Gregarina niphandrodes]EZG43733.1 citrate synthase [Gregarina niphandrodes]|eukprot:XP_011133042.1 citrate synthase [Gregarina niphandrodes]